MNKLTAEKCREQFEEWGKSQRCEIDKWVRGDKAAEYKNPVVAKMWQAWQASRIALPILEQQESVKKLPLRDGIEAIRKSTADSGGYDFNALREHQEMGEWIDWVGGECPVADHVKVEYQLRGGAKGSEPARRLDWRHEGKRHDIIAYRIIPEQPTNQNGEQ